MATTTHPPKIPVRQPRRIAGGKKKGLAPFFAPPAPEREPRESELARRRKARLARLKQYVMDRDVVVMADFRRIERTAKALPDSTVLANWDHATLVALVAKQRKLIEEMLQQPALPLTRLLDKIEAAEAAGRVGLAGHPVDPPAELVAAQAHAGLTRQFLVGTKAILPSGVITERLDMSRQALHKAVHANRLFALDYEDVLYYPAFFADPTLSRRELERVCKVLAPVSNWEKWQFFTNKTLALGDRTPLEALREHELKLVLAAAEGFAE